MTEIEAVEALLANMKKAKQLDEDAAHWLRSEVSSTCVAKECTCNDDSESDEEAEAFACYLERIANTLRETILNSEMINELPPALLESARAFRANWHKANDR